MASSLAKINIHLIFHTKTTGADIRNEDLPRIFQYIGGIIKVHCIDGLHQKHQSQQQQMDKTIRRALRTICMAGRIRSFLCQPLSALKRQFNISAARKSTTRREVFARNTDCSWMRMESFMMRDMLSMTNVCRPSRAYVPPSAVIGGYTPAWGLCTPSGLMPSEQLLFSPPCFHLLTTH